MPTIGEIYDSIITAAIQDDPAGHQLLQEAGEAIFEAHPDKCASAEDGVAAARHNLGYYCQYANDATVRKVKEFYDLDRGYQHLMAGMSRP
jgi:hypothetical protein